MRYYVIKFIVCVSFISIFFIACNEEKKSIKLGVILPLSGGYEGYGKTGLRGIQLAVKEINESGGVLDGRKLELVVGNNKTSPAISSKLAKKMITEDNVLAIFGPVSSTARDAITGIMEKYRTPLFYGIDYEGGVDSRYVFLYAATPKQLSHVIPYVVKKYGNSFYFFGYDYVWPHKMTSIISKEVLKYNGSINGIEYTPFDVKNFNDVFKRIKKSKAKVIVLTLPGVDGYRFLEQFSKTEMHSNVKIIAIASDETYLSNVSEKALEGVITASPFFSSLDRPETIEFVKKHNEMFGENVAVTFATESHYGLVNFLAKAIRRAKTLDKEKIIDAIGDSNVVVGNGKVKMQAAGHHVVLNMIIGEFESGRIVAKKFLKSVSPR